MTNQTSLLRIASDGLSAEIATLGAELQNLSDADGLRLQWDGDPAVWAGRAPILFPIVGMLAGGRYRFDGREYSMPKHGFGRHSTFDVIAHEAASVSLRLLPDAGTHATYPFAFQLDLTFTLNADELRVRATIANRGPGPMPASIGFHPALRWPLPFGRARADHAIRFAQAEPAPIRRIDADGLLLAEPQRSPVVGDTLALRDDLFVDDALIFDRLVSRRVRYGAPQGPCIEVEFDDFPRLGVWTKPGAGFVCIEPWQGIADPVGFTGDLREKPGIIVFAPGESRDCTMTIRLVDGR